MPPEGMGAARGNCGFLSVSTILSKDRYLRPTLQDQTRGRKISIPQQLLAPRDERRHGLTLLWTRGTAKLGSLRFSVGASSVCRCQRGHSVAAKPFKPHGAPVGDAVV